MTKKVFIIGNGESRKDFDLTKLREHGKIYDVMDYYRDNSLLDVLIAVDSTMTHEIYHKGIIHRYFVTLENGLNANFMYQTMKQGFLSTQGKDKEDKFISNGDSALTIGDYFVMNSPQSKVRQR